MMETLYTNQAVMRSLEVVIIIQSSGPGTNYSKAHPAEPEALDDLPKPALAHWILYDTNDISCTPHLRRQYWVQADRDYKRDG